jgi:NADH-quinone oxidoreductase subunit L
VLVLLALLLTVALTAAYCTRAWLVLDDLAAAVPGRHDDDRAPTSVRTAVLVLTGLTVVGGLVVLTPWLPLRGHIGWWMAVVSVLLIAGAAAAVRAVALRAPGPVTTGAAAPVPSGAPAAPVPSDASSGAPSGAAPVVDPAVRLVGAHTASFDAGLGVDRLYVRLVARPVLALARLVVVLDRDVVDAYVRGSAAVALLAGRGGARAHRAERAATSLAWVVAGVVGVALLGVALW